MGNITAKNYELTEEEKALIGLKNVRIINCLPRHAKRSAEVTVNVSKAAKGARKIEAEIIINVPGKKELVARAAGDSVTVAFETAENKIKGQIRRYKDEKSVKKGLIRRIFKRQ
jgi:ribosomal subunit interface protein